ncbi:hypothetical protein Slin14017_G077490 [Septoria linicola]|nr:hypothetical protein Slin14017_G077490 [Septoria linicola]
MHSKPPKGYTKTEVLKGPEMTVTAKIYHTLTKHDTVRLNASTVYQPTTILKHTTEFQQSYVTIVSTSTCTETLTTSLPGRTITEKSWQPASTITQWETVSGPTKLVTVEETEVEYSTVYNTHTATETRVITALGTTTTHYKTIPAGAPETEVITKTLPASTKHLTSTVTASYVPTVVVVSQIPAGPPQTDLVTVPAQVSYVTQSITKDYTTTFTSIAALRTVTETSVSRDVSIETCYKTLPASTIISTSYQAASTIYSYQTITSDHISTVTSVVAPSTVVSYWTSTLPAQTSVSTVYELITKPIYETTTNTLAPSTVTSVQVETCTTAIVSWTTKTLAPSTVVSTEDSA